MEDCKLRDFKGDYEYYLDQNEEEAAKMEVGGGFRHTAVTAAAAARVPHGSCGGSCDGSCCAGKSLYRQECPTGCGLCRLLQAGRSPTLPVLVLHPRLSQVKEERVREVEKANIKATSKMTRAEKERAKKVVSVGGVKAHGRQ